MVLCSVGSSPCYAIAFSRRGGVLTACVVAGDTSKCAASVVSASLHVCGGHAQPRRREECWGGGGRALLDASYTLPELPIQGSVGPP